MTAPTNSLKQCVLKTVKDSSAHQKKKLKQVSNLKNKWPLSTFLPECVHHKAAGVIFLNTESRSHCLSLTLSTALHSNYNEIYPPRLLCMTWPWGDSPTSLPWGSRTPWPSFLPWCPSLRSPLCLEHSPHIPMALSFTSLQSQPRLLLRKAIPDHGKHG